jgi:hypothetical protein
MFISDIDETQVAKYRDKIKSIAMEIEGVNEVIFHARAAKEQRGHVNPSQNMG